MKGIHFTSFATRLSVYIIALTVLIFTIIMSVVYYYSSKKIVRSAIEQTHGLLENMSEQIESQLLVVETAVQNTTWMVERNIATPDSLPSILKSVVATNPAIVGCAIALEPGYFPEKGKHFMLYASKDSSKVSCARLEGSKYDYFGMEWYSTPKRIAKPHWSEPYFDQNGGGIAMTTYSFPLCDKQGHFYGVFTADIALGYLKELAESLKLYPSSHTFIISRKGYFLIYPTEKYILNKTIYEEAVEKDFREAKKLGDEMLAGRTGTIAFETFPMIAFYTDIKSVEWSVCNICPKSIILDELAIPSRKILLITILGILLIFITAYGVIRQLVAPLKGFTASTREIAEGRFDVRLPEIKTHDEMRLLHQSFEFMQKSLDRYIHELKITTAQNERIESELHIAREIQMSMLPKIFPPFPQREDIDLYAVLTPAKEVGGDLYDFFIQDEKLFFVIGDVSGKGVPASLFMAMTRSLFRNIATPELLPEQIMFRLNNAISGQNETGMFVTLFIGILDLRDRHCAYCNAGHNSPVLISPDGRARYMDVLSNIVAGVFEDYEYIGQSCQILPGTRLVLYTDGIVEAENIDKVLYGNEKLLNLLMGNTDRNAKAIIDLIGKSVEEHVGPAEQSDDITMLVVTYKQE